MTRYRTPTLQATVSWTDDGTMARHASSSPGSFELEPNDVAKWSLEKRLVEAAKSAAGHLPAEMRDQFMALFSPESIAITGGCLAIWAGSHFFGIGEIVDLIFLVVGVFTIGFQVVNVASDIWSYFDLSINASNRDHLEQAGKHLAKAITVIGVGTFIALLFKGGKRAGAAVAAENALVDQLLIRVLGSAKNVGALPRENVRIALRFFQANKLNEEQMVNALRGIDLHKPAEILRLPKGTRLIQNIERTADGTVRVGQWFSRSGVSERNLGLAKGNREYKVFELNKDIEVLASKAAPINDTWTQGRTRTVISPVGGKPRAGEMVGGGGEQYFVPGAWSHVTEIR